MKKLILIGIITLIVSMIASLIWVVFDYKNYIPYLIYTLLSIVVWVSVYFYGKHN